MKKLIILSSTLLLSCSLAFAEPGFNPSVINDIQTFQGINTHDMNSFRQQKFRYEEIDDSKDIKEVKEKHNKQTKILNETTSKKPYVFNSENNINFVEENGEIKIEGSESVKNQPLTNEESDSEDYKKIEQIPIEPEALPAPDSK